MATKKSRVINVHEAKTHLSRLLERAHQGEEIILAKGGTPYARLVPLADPETRKPGLLRGLKLSEEFFDPLPDAELHAWEEEAHPRGDSQ
jgi:prevent-host-death family protein